MLVARLRTRRYPVELLACHDRERTPEEFPALVDIGIVAFDVAIAHAVCSEIRGGLQLASRTDAEYFSTKVEYGSAYLYAE